MKHFFRTSLIMLLAVLMVVGLSVPSQASAQTPEFFQTAANCVGINIGDVLGGIGDLIGDLSGFPGLGQAVPVDDEVVRETTGDLRAKEGCLDAVAFFAAKLISQNLTDQSREWIQGGFEDGNEGFVIDLKQRGRDAIQKEFNYFLVHDVGLRNTCADWIDEVGQNVVINFNNTYTGETGISSSGLGDLSSSGCELDVITDGNADAFLQGDLTQGGWDAWDAFVFSEGNNPTTAFVKTSSRLTSDAERAYEREIDSVSGAGGFIPDVECPGGAPPSATGLCSDGSYPEVKTPAETVGRIINDILESDSRRLDVADELNEILAIVGDLFVTRVEEDGLRGTEGGSVTGAPTTPTPGVDDNEDYESCQEYLNERPQAIAVQVMQAIQTRSDRLDQCGNVRVSQVQQCMNQAHDQFEQSVRNLLIAEFGNTELYDLEPFEREDLVDNITNAIVIESRDMIPSREQIAGVIRNSMEPRIDCEQYNGDEGGDTPGGTGDEGDDEVDENVGDDDDTVSQGVRTSHLAIL